MKMRHKGIIIPQPINPGTQTRTQQEKMESISFNIHKFSNRIKPDKKYIIIISCFSEFGCETLGALYCLPRIIREYPGAYVIAMGWYGREYLYRHLVDEFWEAKEEHQWLREYCRAFHHDSKNLKKLESEVRKFGHAIPSHVVGRYAIAHTCRECRHVWLGEHESQCPKCSGENIIPSLFGDINASRREAVRLPNPSRAKLLEARQYVPDRAVGIFARGRVCYGRNLQPEFYVKLIHMLRDMNYNPIWLGEKQTTQPCLVEGVVDFSRSEKARDLELTCAIIYQLDFTIQYWTASTRLAGMMGTPYLLFESPDQIWGNGQEGYRRNLCDFGPRKLCVSHYKNVYENNESALQLTKRCIEEMEQKNYEDVIGMIDSDAVVQSMRQSAKDRLGGYHD